MRLFFAVALVSCTSTPTGTLKLTTGGEIEVFSRSPAPTTLHVEAIDAQGKITPLATARLPADRVDLGERSTDTVARIHVTGTDDSGKVLVEGSSVPVQLGALGGLSLPVFVQRNGEFARLPSPLADARAGGLAALFIGRYLLVAGGSDPATAKKSQLYDFGSLSPFDAPPVLPRAPRSLVAVGTRALLVDDSGASWFQLSDSTSAEAAAPSGGTFAEVAGGSSVIGSDGTTWVVGGTRASGEATARVLRVTLDGTLSFASLSGARLGASAAWVEGRGLVIAGGSATAAGAEILGAGATSGSALPFAPDATQGQGSASLDASHLLLAGGVDAGGSTPPTRVLDLTCGSACAAVPWKAPLPGAFPRADLFALDATSALLVGDDAAGATRAIRLDASAARELPLKVARKGGRGVRFFAGAIAVVGGAKEIEAFLP